MDTQLDIMIRLAALDSEIDGLRKKLDQIPRAIDARKKVYLDAAKILDDARENLATMQKEHRKAEGELDSHLEKIRKLNDQQSLVKTNKEYQALLSEIEKLKVQQDAYEERILELMEKSGEVEKAIVAVKTDVAGEKKVFEQEEGELLKEEESLRGELERVEAARAELVPSIERENFEMYSRIKGLRGAAVAEVANELCLGCRVSVPPQKYADVIMNQSIQNCANCQRILFFRNKEKMGRPSE